MKRPCLPVAPQRSVLRCISHAEKLTRVLGGMYIGFSPSIEGQITPFFVHRRFMGLCSVQHTVRYETVAIQQVGETHTFGYKRNVSRHALSLINT